MRRFHRRSWRVPRPYLKLELDLWIFGFYTSIMNKDLNSACTEYIHLDWWFLGFTGGFALYTTWQSERRIRGDRA